MDEHVMKTYARAEEVFVRGSGARLWDERGDEYLDFLGGIAVSALGHGHPRLVAALREQVGEVLHVSNLYRHPWTEKAATQLTQAAGMEEVFFSNSGSEAVECALKLARKYQIQAGRPQRRGFVALEGSFHGRTLGALSVTSSERYRAPFAPLVPGVAFVDPEDFGALDQALARKPAALILEAIQGEGGIRSLSNEFLRAAREECDATGTVLIADEVQSGCGRTGSFLAIDAAGVKPDIVALAKPLGGGLPMGATLAAAPLAGALVPGDHGSTFGGGPLACRAACVLLEELAGGLADNVRVRGAQLRSGLESLEAGFPHRLRDSRPRPDARPPRRRRRRVAPVRAPRARPADVRRRW